MSYASDYDDFEQSAQGADGGESDLEAFCERMFGRAIWELSNREVSDLTYQFSIENKQNRRRK